MAPKLSESFITSFRANAAKHEHLQPYLRIIRMNIAVAPLTTLTVTDGDKALEIHLSNKMAEKAEHGGKLIGRVVHITGWKMIEVYRTKTMLVTYFMV